MKLVRFHVAPASTLRNVVGPSSRGGIGRRVRLRTVWGNPWRFESSREHSHLHSVPVTRPASASNSDSRFLDLPRRCAFEDRDSSPLVSNLLDDQAPFRCK